ncbi:MAG: GTP 3',8-cyclase MoaA [Desulfobulbaceae bacterium]|nr:GTP 3',8-cyclase MoaA [Desulfobulbaceae bacterium]
MTDTSSPTGFGKNEAVDSFSRKISYLRLSVTDRCNLRCSYCDSGKDRGNNPVKLEHGDLLAYEEILRVVGVAAGMGISKIRLTGGEPLVRKNFLSFVERLAALDGVEDIRLTTNGVLFERYAAELLRAGIRKVNISLDSLKPERFARITSVDCFHRVRGAIDTALRLGFASVKLNMVVMRGINDDELLDFASLSLRERLQVRFIEYMPMGGSRDRSRKLYVSNDEIMDKVGRLGELEPVERGMGAGPARVYRLAPKAPGTVGFISPISHKFCEACNRLRLTSEGRLRSCLLHDGEFDIRRVLRSGGSDEEIRQTLLTAVRSKPRGHELQSENAAGGCHGRMSRIGG